MNILFFITPKNEVSYIFEEDNFRQAVEKMESHRYTAVPLLSRDGKYVGTVTEGDLLRGLKQLRDLSLRGAERLPITSIPRRSDNLPVLASANMEDLIDKALNQNFVPVVDDRGYFIGIITRRDIIRYYYEKGSRGEAENPEA